MSTTTAEAGAEETCRSSLGAQSVAAPLAECEDELVCALIVRPEVA